MGLTIADYGGFSAVHARVSPAEVSAAMDGCVGGTVAVFFSSHEAVHATYENGRTLSKAIQSGEGCMLSESGGGHVEFAEPVEFVAFRPTADLRQSICDDLQVPEAADLATIKGLRDPVIWAAGLRLRAHALGGWELSGLEADALIERLLRHLVQRHLGGRPPRSTSLVLDDRRLHRVTDFMESRLDADITLDDLADTAALSRFHFIRAFNATTGLTPHRFLLGQRMERARALITDTDWPIGQIARTVGYADSQAFRRAFGRFFGASPSSLRQ